MSEYINYLIQRLYQLACLFLDQWQEIRRYQIDKLFRQQSHGALNARHILKNDVFGIL